jgi:addiction module HigA family antidote
MGITASELAIDLGGPVGQINELVHGMHPITPDIALRLGRHFKMDPVFWVSLQTEYDTRVIDTCQGWKEVDAAWPDH